MQKDVALMTRLASGY